MRFTDRSRIVQTQRCQRSRYWGYEYGGRGIAPYQQRVELSTGLHVHIGLDKLLHGCDIEESASNAVAEYRKSCVDYGLEVGENERRDYVVEEQAALIEGLLRVAHLRVIPRLLAEYEVVWVERELTAELAPDVTFMSRPDGLLKHKETGDLYILSWKTKARWDKRAGEDATHDDQGLSETWLTEKWLANKFDAYNLDGEAWPLQVNGVIMIWLMKGDRRESPRGSGVHTQQSPLIRGYRKVDEDGSQKWAHSYEWWDDVEQRSRKLGKGWERRDIWSEPSGVKGWISALATGQVQPDAPDPLDAAIHWPAPFYRQQQHVDDWVEQVRRQEADIAWDDGDVVINEAWPQSRHSCSYPSRCQFYNLCWGPQYAAADPLANGFRWRTPHHAAEVEEFKKVRDQPAPSSPTRA